MSKLKELTETIDRFITRLEKPIAAISLIAVLLHLVEKFIFPEQFSSIYFLSNDYDLLLVLLICGIPLVLKLFLKVLDLEFGSDLLAAISIVTSYFLGEYLAGVLVVLMLSGGAVLEAYAVKSASSVLNALANRMPSVAQKKDSTGLKEVPISEIKIDDLLVVFPHALCPVDGTVVEGHGSMDESYLTGEPYQVSKAPGTTVLSGAVNGESALTIKCAKIASDSRYSKIMKVMRDSEQHKPRIRRLGDQLGAWYTPIALILAIGTWMITGDSIRFLSVLVVATPCPLLIAIPVAIISSISLAARVGIIIKDPAILEKISTCSVAIFDKTGTLTYGKPKLTEIILAEAASNTTSKDEILSLAASVERYSKHPLSSSILEEAALRKLSIKDAKEVMELPGDGLKALVDGKRIHITSRKKFLKKYPNLENILPEVASGMECLIIIDDIFTAVLRFRDEPRADGIEFIKHLKPNHDIHRVMLVSGDRESEVKYLADYIGISEVFYSQSPEQKLELVRKETLKAGTIFLGDGINDAPALTAATVGIAFGNNTEITGEAADAVILDSSLGKVDILFHISKRLRIILLQSAVGGMALSIIGMAFASAGYLPPVTGAILQEVIDIFAVLNALRASVPPKNLSDF